LLAFVPPGQRGGQGVDARRLETEHPARIAQRTLGPVGDQRRRQRRPFARVFSVNVGNDLGAPFVFEIDVDVGRFATLLRDETLEQHARAIRADLGNAQRETNNRIGRRTASLAQDIDAAREADDVVHRQKIGFVFELGDQRQFVFDELAHLIRNALRIATKQAALGFVAQPGGWRMASLDDFLRVFVTQFIERKAAQLGDLQRFGQQFRRIEARQAQAGAQMALGIGKQRVASLENRRFQTQRGQRILHRPARLDVHMDVASCHQRQATSCAERLQIGQTGRIVRPGVEFDGDPRPPGKAFGQPESILDQGALARHPENQAVGDRTVG